MVPVYRPSTPSHPISFQPFLSHGHPLLNRRPSPSMLSPVLHVLLRRLGTGRTSSPTLRRSLPLRWVILQRHSLPVCLRHYILPILKWLCEVTDRAHDIMVAMDAERNHWNEAKCKPRIALDHPRRPIPLKIVSQEVRMSRWKKGRTYAIMALAENVLIALELLRELVFSAGEDKTHVGCCGVC